MQKTAVNGRFSVRYNYNKIPDSVKESETF